MNTFNQIWESYFPFYIAGIIFLNLWCIGMQLTFYKEEKPSKRVGLLIVGICISVIPVFNSIIAFLAVMVALFQVVKIIKLKLKK